MSYLVHTKPMPLIGFNYHKVLLECWLKHHSPSCAPAAKVNDSTQSMLAGSLPCAAGMGEGGRRAPCTSEQGLRAPEDQPHRRVLPSAEGSTLRHSPSLCRVCFLHPEGSSTPQRLNNSHLCSETPSGLPWTLPLPGLSPEPHGVVVPSTPAEQLCAALNLSAHLSFSRRRQVCWEGGQDTLPTSVACSHPPAPRLAAHAV